MRSSVDEILLELKIRLTQNYEADMKTLQRKVRKLDYLFKQGKRAGAEDLRQTGLLIAMIALQLTCEETEPNLFFSNFIPPNQKLK